MEDISNYKKFKLELENIKKSNIIKKKDKILLAFSGGPDSIFMYYILENIKKFFDLELSLVYINHNLRNDVYNDIRIVEKFSVEHNVKLYIENIDVKTYSKKNKKSIELSARELRYKKIKEVLNEINYNKIATGHNLDDNVETIIFRLIRGTSLEGLKGIPIKRENIIRPILNFEKSKILEFLDRNNIEYVKDYTNLENEYTRNYIRNKIFPLFKNINSNFKNKINNLIKEVNLDSLDENKKKFVNLMKKNGVNISREKINSIFNDLYDLDGKIRIEGSKKYSLGNGKVLIKEYENISIIQEKEFEKKYIKHLILKKNGKINWKNYEIGYFDSLKINFKTNINAKYYKLKINLEEILIRSRIDGDKIKLKNVGTRKVKKIFIDKKIPKWKRDDIPILLDDKKRILSLGNIEKSLFLEEINIENIKENDYILFIREEK